ncbi:MAG TPA: DUF881 domain-containing protein [Mycobacteriales bacterium]|nr:DUF881 domain-containing protein [Mycobacteriales bacterium]
MGGGHGDRAWGGLVPVACLLAGMLFSTSAETAKGTDLRPDRRPDLASLIADTERKVAGYSDRVTTLEDQIDTLEMASAKDDRRVSAERARAGGLESPVGLRAVHGPGLSVVLDDAPRRPDGTLTPNARNADDLVVHQQDVQAVVNAMWAGGAEAMTIQDQRIITTGAVKCVGNTLLLYGHVYSPPFRIVAIGDPDRLRRALDRSGGVQEYRRAVAYFGLGYRVSGERDTTLPGYDGPIRLGYAKSLPDTASN